jgi:mannose-6-phosphate isomerase-like protein (cupin superfamily)
MPDTLHQMTPEIAALTVEEVAARYTARFIDRTPDWDAFADARVEGYKRAQHRFIGAGGSGKHGDPNVIPPAGFTLSIMYVPPGQGNAAHTHEVEEVFFVLDGQLVAFFEDANGKRVDVTLGKWDCVACPAGVIHGYENQGLEPVYFQVMLGRGIPELMGYTDPSLLADRDIHLLDPRP